MPGEDVLGVGAAVHVDPAGRVAHQHGHHDVRQVVAAHHRAGRRADHPARVVDDGHLLLGCAGHDRQSGTARTLADVSVWRVMGTETEYGISVPGNPGANAMLISSQIVNAYAQSSTARSRRTRWDFEEENPLRDARGFDLARDVADPTQLTDEDVGLANVILTNGARFYVDHAHPEYSGPECTNPRDALIWDRAGERIMAEASRRAAAGAEHAADQPLQEQHRQQGCVLRHPRELPDAPRDAVRRHRAAPHAVLRQPPGGHRLRPGRHRPGRARRRLPDLAARRLLRGRGRSRDDAEATDHQHPRRAARGGREVPPAARHHRRRQPGRGLDLPQARHDRAGAGDDRGPVPVRRPHRRPAGGDPARGVARPDAARAGDAAVGARR